MVHEQYIYEIKHLLKFLMGAIKFIHKLITISMITFKL
jgi:hypothetical protein